MSSFATGLEWLVEKVASPQRAAKLQALANHPATNVNEAAVARTRLREMGGVRPPAPAAPPAAAPNPRAQSASQYAARETADRHDPLFRDMYAQADRNFAHSPNTMGAATPPARTQMPLPPKPAGPGLMRRGMGTMARGLAVPAAVGLAGLGYGLARQNEGDERNQRGAYPSMGPGSVYGN